MNDFHALRTVCVSFAVILLCACASTIETTRPDGEKELIKVGFGNRISRDKLTVEPSPAVVEAGERLAKTASTEVLTRVIDAASTAGR